jgi:hypothetical protein
MIVVANGDHFSDHGLATYRDELLSRDDAIAGDERFGLNSQGCSGPRSSKGAVATDFNTRTDADGRSGCRRAANTASKANPSSDFDAGTSAGARPT